MTSNTASIFNHWDYLIITASNSFQALSYERQLKLRQDLGTLSGFKHIQVVSDPEGKRIGSGGSTILCLLEVLNRELEQSGALKSDPVIWQKILENLRILIIHAGGDSRRLPPYGPGGKIFIPIPGESDNAFPLTLFDRLLPVYQGLPCGPLNSGQVVVTTGDVLLEFNPDDVNYNHKGIIGLGCYAEPEVAKNHGVFCPKQNGQVRLFLQKPSPPEQESAGAQNRFGQSILDIGVMHLDAESAVKLISIGSLQIGKQGKLEWSKPFKSLIFERGLDFYRDACCAMGTESSLEHLKKYSQTTNLKNSLPLLNRIYEKMSTVPFFVEVLPGCHFFHFGTLGQLINSGSELMSKLYGVRYFPSHLNINNIISEKGSITGENAWIEGCRIEDQLLLGGNNVVIGIDIKQSLTIPPRMCVDVIPGKNRIDQAGWFVRCYGTYDQFHIPIDSNPLFCDQPINTWLQKMKLKKNTIFSKAEESNHQNLWHAQLFPFIRIHDDYREWLWLLENNERPQIKIDQWKKSDRYSLEEIAILTDQQNFHLRRFQNKARDVKASIPRYFHPKSCFSAKELGFVLENLNDVECTELISVLLQEMFKNYGDEKKIVDIHDADRFEFPRILHSMGSALDYLIEKKGGKWWSDFSTELLNHLNDEEKKWLGSIDLDLTAKELHVPLNWPNKAKKSAFHNLSRIILMSDLKKENYPISVLRSDEIVWGRAPARLDLGGGWTDTPPYSLEYGGCVINAAVDLNGQPPIHSYARITKEPVINITSIDHGSRISIKNLEDLMDYREPTSQFGLAKAALVLTGFAHHTARWPQRVKTLEQMLALFGGGIELTTLAAIPSGSGLGTSSIMGAVLLAVINRMKGIILSQRDLFHLVLQLEQELTTGGGWQDQIGGVIDGVKIITTDPGMIPDPYIHHVSSDLLDPSNNKGQTLLYYTGIRRLAKNILQYVVANYLDRDRSAMTVLRQLHSHPPMIAETLSIKNIKKFGEMIDIAWNLNKTLDPDSTTDKIEEVLARVKPHIYGAKLLGAGGGGFLLIVSRSTKDAERIRRILESDPPNDKARFFDYGISREGLVVTVC